MSGVLISRTSSGEQGAGLVGEVVEAVPAVGAVEVEAGLQALGGTDPFQVLLAQQLPAQVQGLAVQLRGGAGHALLDLDAQPAEGLAAAAAAAADGRREPVRLGIHDVNVVQGAQARTDVPVVGDVMAALGEQRGMEGVQPQGVDPELGPRYGSREVMPGMSPRPSPSSSAKLRGQIRWTTACRHQFGSDGEGSEED